MELSKSAQAALILHDAQKAVSGRGCGAWWLMDRLKWEFIDSLPTGPEHSFVLAVIRSFYSRRSA
jgi:hypothetical protein